MPEDKINTIEGQECPVCHEKKCRLTEMERHIPFGSRNIPVLVFSMTCSNCRYHKADVEFAEQQAPSKCTFEVSGEKDLNTMVVRSGEGTVKVPHIVTIEGGPTSNGYITTVEGLLKRVKGIIELRKENSEDEQEKKKAKNLLKKLTRIMWGQEKCRIIIEDKTGNSDILSGKTERKKL